MIVAESLFRSGVIASSVIVLACVSEAGYGLKKTGDDVWSGEYVCVYGKVYRAGHCEFILAVSAVSLVYNILAFCATLAGECDGEQPGYLLAIVVGNGKPRLQRYFVFSSLVFEAVLCLLWFASLGVQYKNADFEIVHGHKRDSLAAAMFFSVAASATTAICLFCRCSHFEWKKAFGKQTVMSDDDDPETVVLTVKNRFDVIAASCLILTLLCSIIVLSLPLQHVHFSKATRNLSGDGEDYPQEESKHPQCVFAGHDGTCTMVSVSAAISLCVSVFGLLHLPFARLYTKCLCSELQVVRAVLATHMAELWLIAFSFAVHGWRHVTIGDAAQLSEAEENGAKAAQAFSFLAVIFWLLIAYDWWYTQRASSRNAQNNRVSPRKDWGKCEKQRTSWRYLEFICERDDSGQLQRELLFAHERDECYCTKCGKAELESEGHTRQRGGEKYSVPDGWCLFPVNVQMMLCRGDLSLPRRGGEIMDWPVAYHGTNSTALRSILIDGKLCKPGETSRHTGRKVQARRDVCTDANARLPRGTDFRQVFLTPSMKYASYYARHDSDYIDRATNVHYRSACVAVQVAVKPGVYVKQPETVVGLEDHQHDPEFPGDEAEWCVWRSDDVVVTGVLVRLLL